MIATKIAELEAHRPADPDVLEAAKQIVAETINRKLPLASSVITSVLLSVVRRVYTTAIPTMAVTLAADGFPILLVNPDFAVQLEEDGVMFVLVHEAYHLILLHLLADPHLREHPNWEIATEACINYRAMRLLGRGLPTITTTTRTGKPKVEETGVNPRKVFDDYRKALKAAGEEPLDRIEDFYRTDLGCFAELERMPRPPRQKVTVCLHGGAADADGSEQGETGAAAGTAVHLDPVEVGKLAGKVLDIALHEAVANGNKTAKEELLQLMEATDDSEKASKIWGDLGAGKLRGETTATRKTDAWERWTQDAIATRLRDGMRLRYNKKIPWDPRVTPRGREPMKYGVIGIDSSGSMPQTLLDKLAALVGTSENLEVTWVCWDGDVWPFKPGEALRGGGGTNCQRFDDWIAEQVDNGTLEQAPDFVLCVTDGYFTKFTPRDPEAWIWLITPDGDPWPQSWQPPMTCRQIDIV